MQNRQWYFNTVTQQPEYGPLSPASQRMGPYASKEDALRAWDIAQHRNLLWDDEDRRWKQWGDTQE